MRQMRLCRRMPGVVDDWLVKSERLGWEQVRCADWDAAHRELEEEELHL